MVHRAEGTDGLTSPVDPEIQMKTQHKMALAVLGGILVVLVIFLVISLTRGDDTNSNNRRGGGVGIARLQG
jgi:hypothetical protein